MAKEKFPVEAARERGTIEHIDLYRQDSKYWRLRVAMQEGGTRLES